MSDGWLKDGARFPYCKGCGHATVLRALNGALTRLDLDPSDVAIVTDIGCVGLADDLFARPHTVHTTHGRSVAFAAGMSLADSVLGPGTLKPVVLLGDGGAAMGINHLVNAALLNPDVTVIVHNNFLFGMTGGQNSSFSPLGFVTSTTKAGNAQPPLDLARVLLACRASFVARATAGDKDLAELIARAIAHPGFAIVEVLELCTAYGTRWNEITGAKLREVAVTEGYELGVLRDEPRPMVRDAVSRPKPAPPAGGSAPSRRMAEPARFRASLPAQAGLVLAGTAGERVQTAATILAQAAMACGLRATQKNDNPVTQGSGFSLSEVTVSPDEILYTGIEVPDALIVVSADGAAEMGRAGIFARVTPRTVVYVDEDVAIPDVPARLVRRPFRKTAGPKNAALAAAATWVHESGLLPPEAFDAALDLRLGDHAASAREMLARSLAVGA